eukprot:ANDGO_08414.mRNA.1 hypothetical protein
MEMMRKMGQALRITGDGSSSQYFYSIMDDSTWASSISKHSKKLRDLPLYKFDSLGFYRPVDDPSGHLTSIYGTAVSSAKLEKLHQGFQKGYAKANEIINEIFEKEIEKHGMLDWLQPGSTLALGMAGVPSMLPMTDAERAAEDEDDPSSP